MTDPSNGTVLSTAVAALACPSDPSATVREANNNQISPKGVAPAGGLPRWFYTSYVGSAGTTDITATIYPDARGFARSDGAFCEVYPISPATIPDGLSQTIFVGERATDFLAQLAPYNSFVASYYGWYFAGSPGHTLFLTFYPPNMPRKVAAGAGLNHAFAASSLHPGGINVLFGDGSVRFVKETIDTWPFDPITGRPLGATMAPGGHWDNLPKPGVWQALSTRAGGEAVSGDAY